MTFRLQTTPRSLQKGSREIKISIGHHMRIVATNNHRIMARGAQVGPLVRLDSRSTTQLWRCAAAALGRSALGSTGQIVARGRLVSRPRFDRPPTGRGRQSGTTWTREARWLRLLPFCARVAAAAATSLLLLVYYY